MGRVKSSISSIITCAAALTLLSAALVPVSAGNLIQPYRLVSGHTAEILPRSFFDTEINIYAARGGYGSGLITGVHVGLTDRLMIGLSYGGEGLVGYSDNVRWYSYPGVMVKYRIFEEGVAPPAVVIGFDNQGYGGPAGESAFGYDGYLFKSPGFFLAVSKSYMMLNAVQIGFHGTANYSLEGMDDVKWPNIMAGMDIVVNDELSLITEYDFAFNDRTGRGKGKRYYAMPQYGFLNIGLRWAFTQNFHLEFDVRDILENKTVRSPTPDNPDNRVPIGWSRELKVVYISKF
ncbi:MAG: hypothetical protein FWB94_11450 [Chitinispirillia bacterium]|nr:hypothetical protein [Chitinispirillia bacterium]